jgi:hypothetical protein
VFICRSLSPEVKWVLEQKKYKKLINATQNIEKSVEIKPLPKVPRLKK